MPERGGFEPPVPFRIYKAKLSAQVARFSATEFTIRADGEFLRLNFG